MTLNLTALVLGLSILFAGWVIDDSNARKFCEETRTHSTCMELIKG